MDARADNDNRLTAKCIFADLYNLIIIISRAIFMLKIMEFWALYIIILINSIGFSIESDYERFLYDWKEENKAYDPFGTGNKDKVAADLNQINAGADIPDKSDKKVDNVAIPSNQGNKTTDLINQNGTVKAGPSKSNSPRKKKPLLIAWTCG